MKNSAKLKSRLIALSALFAVASTSNAIECEIRGEARPLENSSSTEQFPMESEFTGSNFNFDLESGSMLNLPELNGHSWELNLYIPRPTMRSYTALFESVTLPREEAQLEISEIEQEGSLKVFSFFMVIGQSISYFGRCESSPNN